MYSLSFSENKKSELQIDFNGASSLRSFVERKLTSFDKFTTLPFINQIEMVMNDLPVQISSLFLTNEMMTGNKNDILCFCDSIQELVGTMTNTEGPSANDNDQSNQASNEPSYQMEVFEYDSGLKIGPSQSESMSVRGRSKRVARGGARGGATGGIVQENSDSSGGIVKRGRPHKKLKTIPENTDSSNFDFMNQMSNTSRSSWSSN